MPLTLKYIYHKMGNKLCSIVSWDELLLLSIEMMNESIRLVGPSEGYSPLYLSYKGVTH